MSGKACYHASGDTRRHRHYFHPQTRQPPEVVEMELWLDRAPEDVARSIRAATDLACRQQCPPSRRKRCVSDEVCGEYWPLVRRLKQ